MFNTKEILGNNRIFIIENFQNLTTLFLLPGIAFYLTIKYCYDIHLYKSIHTHIYINIYIYLSMHVGCMFIVQILQFTTCIKLTSFKTDH